MPTFRASATLSAIAALGMVHTSPAEANYQIQWQNYSAAVTWDGTSDTPILPNLGDTMILQLVYAGPDGSIDPILFPDGSSNGDDVVLATEVFINTDGELNSQFGAGWAYVYGGPGTPFLGPDVYFRFILGDEITFGTPFTVSQMFTVNQKTFIPDFPPPSPDVIGYYLATILTIDRAVPIAGDTDVDGVVDDFDLATLQQNLGNPGDWFAGDFDGDGIVSLYDAYLLLTNYEPGMPVSLAATPIPEPASLILVSLGGAALLRRRS